VSTGSTPNGVRARVRATIDAALARRAPLHPVRAFAAGACIVIASGALLAVAAPQARQASYTAPIAAMMLQGDPLASQSLTVDPLTVAAHELPQFTGSTGVEGLKAVGTNAAWAEMVLLFGGFPRTQENITVILRWMRQENYVDNWWNRNNPLNNGWGTLEGNFLSGYSTLVDAAEQAADALHSRAGYAGIVAALSAGGSADATAAAIWASDWATGHYNNGAHWSTAEVPIVTAPADAWG
jgi:hypothetical protein